MVEESPEEADFIAFVRAQSSDLDDEWAEIAEGRFSMAEIVDPLFARLEMEKAEADALSADFAEGFAGYVRTKNRDIANRMRHLTDIAAEQGHGSPGRYFAGRFPTHSFNAQACRQGRTQLLLIHTGFERLLVEGARLLFAIHDKIGPVRVERWPEPSWWAGASVEELVNNFADLLASYVADAEPYPFYLDADLYPFEPENELPAFSAAAAAQDFALAHELGHILKGHLDAANNDEGAPARQLRSGLEVIANDHTQEHEADGFAGHLLFCTPPTSAEQPVLDLIYGKYLGVGLFFDFDGVVSEIEARAFGLEPTDETQTHPPARVREAVMLRDIRGRIVSQHLFVDRRAIGRTFRKIRDALVNRALHRLVDRDVAANGSVQGSPR